MPGLRNVLYMQPVELSHPQPRGWGRSELLLLGILVCMTDELISFYDSTLVLLSSGRGRAHPRVTFQESRGRASFYVG